MITKLIKIAIGIVLFILVSSNSIVLFQLTAVFIFLAMALHTFISKFTGKTKLFLASLYLMIMIFQLVYNSMVILSDGNNIVVSILNRIIGSILIVMPVFVNRMASEIHGINSYMPSIQDMTVFTFNEIIENAAKIKEIAEKGRKNLSKAAIDEVLQDLPRHNSFRYINKGSLTGEYFELAYQTLKDPHIYIIVSDTGSPASEIISLFTRKRYNHASLSFDRELKTIVSYNGGERIYPPGLNMEMARYFNKKPDSSIIVYSLTISPEKKKVIIDKIKEINEQGSAYNMVGLALKHSFKQNIMFCSQFVYKMLKLVDVNYFEKQDGKIKPTDLVEMDYERKLKYEYKIQFNEN
jgi:hypothetical protein